MAYVPFRENAHKTTNRGGTQAASYDKNWIIIFWGVSFVLSNAIKLVTLLKRYFPKKQGASVVKRLQMHLLCNLGMTRKRIGKSA